MSDREKVIETACALAESSFVEPTELMSMTKELEKYNISREDFLKVLSENPNEAILRKVVKWVPKAMFSKEELNYCIEREDFKLAIFGRYNEIYKKDKRIKELLSKGFFLSWEFMDNFINNL